MAQNSNKIKYEAKYIEGGKLNDATYKKLVGNVKFIQKTTIIYCDSALLYDQTNSMEAFGHVKIEDLEDSVVITSNKLLYNGNGRVAELRGNVVYIDDSLELYTDNLDYDMTNKSATYFEGGKIIDDMNTLESINGNYDTESKLMIFNDSVSLVNEDYTLESNDLVYNIITKKARTSSKTTITTKDGKKLVSEMGSEFDTANKTSSFLVGEIDTESYLLKGDELFFNSHLGTYSAKGNVFVLAKNDNIIITGDNANFWEDSGKTEVYGNSLLKKVLNDDTLFLRADTLISIDDSLEVNKRLLAYHNVKIFKGDLQGISDSLAYYIADSSITFFDDPVLWNAGSQITADTIHILVKDGTIDRLETSVNSFIISEDSSQNFNQIKGRQMVAYFDGKIIKNVDVTGNGESIYFVSDEENTKTMIGMNKIICSNMKIFFKDNQVNDIRFYTNPDGDFIPPHELKEDIKKLDGFAWRIDERPSKIEILMDPADTAKFKNESVEIHEIDVDEKNKLNQMLKNNTQIDKIKGQLKAPSTGQDNK